MNRLLDRSITDLGEDEFQRIFAVKAIANEFKHAKEGFNFLLSGEWGSGKTSMLNLLEKELKKGNSVAVIKFNPWKYLQSKDKTSVTRKLLIEIRKTLGEKNPEGNLYESTTFEIIHWSKIIPILFTNLLLSGIWFISVSLFILGTIVLINYLFGIKISLITTYEKYIFIPGIAACIQLLTVVIASVKTKSSVAEHIEQFEDLFRKTVDNSNLKKIFIFIDDLDRCNESDVQQILTSLFTIFEHKKCFYIVAADYRIIEPFAGSSVSRNPNQLEIEDLTKNGKEYLKKIFQFIYRIPPLSFDKIDDQVEKMLKNNE